MLLFGESLRTIQFVLYPILLIFSEEDYIGIDITKINETKSSSEDEEEMEENFKFDIKNKTFKHAEMYHLVNNFDITRKYKLNEEMIKSTMKQLKVRVTRYKKSIIQIIDELYNMKTDKDKDLANQGGRPTLIAHY